MAQISYEELLHRIEVLEKSGLKENYVVGEIPKVSTFNDKVYFTNYDFDPNSFAFFLNGVYQKPGFGLFSFVGQNSFELAFELENDDEIIVDYIIKKEFQARKRVINLTNDWSLREFAFEHDLFTEEVQLTVWRRDNETGQTYVIIPDGSPGVEVISETQIHLRFVDPPFANGDFEIYVVLIG